MSCFSRRKQDKKIRKKYKIHPEPVEKTMPSVYDKPFREIGEIIGKEKIKCGVCSQIFSLNEGEIVGSCVGCDRFLHCGIAGKCIGDDCKYIINGVCDGDSSIFRWVVDSDGFCSENLYSIEGYPSERF